MYDAYRALIEDTTPLAKSLAATQLQKYVPIYSAQSFARAFETMSLDVNATRLEKVLFDAFYLGRNAQSGQINQAFINAVHKPNADWLVSTISRTGCFREEGAAYEPQSIAQGEGRLQAANSAGTPQSTRNSMATDFEQTGVLASVLLIILAGLTCYLIYHSRYFRIKRTERLPRHTVAFKSSASFGNTAHSIIILDISQGGAKIECDHPPLPKENITLHLSCGSIPATIVWATAFYAGVMFEHQLSEEELQAVLEDDGVTTRSRLSNVF